MTIVGKLTARKDELSGQMQALIDIFTRDKHTGFHIKTLDTLERMVRSYSDLKDTTPYTQSYLEILGQAIETVKNDSQASLIHLKRLVYQTDGRNDAVDFCVEHVSEPDEIRKKIKDKERFVSSGRASAKPNASPRLHADGMLQELNYWLEIITNDQ